MVANCDHLRKLKFSPSMPYAFTEHGAVMLASVFNSQVAIEASIQVVRAFLKDDQYIWQLFFHPPRPELVLKIPRLFIIH